MITTRKQDFRSNRQGSACLCMAWCARARARGTGLCVLRPGGYLAKDRWIYGRD